MYLSNQKILLPCSFVFVFTKYWWLKTSNERKIYWKLKASGTKANLGKERDFSSASVINWRILLSCSHGVSIDRFPPETLWSQSKQTERMSLYRLLSSSVPFKEGRRPRWTHILLSVKPCDLLGLIKIHGLPRTPDLCSMVLKESFLFWYQGIWCHNLKDSYCTSKGSC